MAAALPDTPATLLSRLKDPGSVGCWNDGWRQFVRDYNRAIRMITVGELTRLLKVPPAEHLIEDVETLVLSAIAEIQMGRRPYDRRIGKFRSMLRRIVSNKAVDVIRKSQHLFREQSLELPELGEGEEGAMQAETLADPAAERQQDQAYREALLKSLMDEVRKRVSPEQMAIFELVKLHGESPVDVAGQFDKTRPAIDKAVSRVLALLRELARRPEYSEEFQ
jgi:RNA polymerase sigma factor (sigma-70 family)